MNGDGYNFPPELFRAIFIKCKFNYRIDCVTKCQFAVGRLGGQVREGLRKSLKKVELPSASDNRP